MNIEKIIQQLGYKYKEVKVYLAALMLGESNVADIATKTKMPRTSVAVIVEKLRKDGLLSFYSTRVKKYWVATSPEVLLGRHQENVKSLQSIMPELKTLQHSQGGLKPSVKIYTGAEEIGMVFDDMIATRKNVSGIVAWCDLNQVLGEEFVTEFLRKQQENFLKLRLIVPENETTKKLKAADSCTARETKFLPDKIPLNTANFMYGNKLVIISFNNSHPTAFLIEDLDVHNTMALFFSKIWES